MDKTYFLTQSTALSLVIVICLIFLSFGIYYSKNYQGLKNYLTANRNIRFLSLTTSLTASALGAWILFGPASAATWGGMLGFIYGADDIKKLFEVEMSEKYNIHRTRINFSNDGIDDFKNMALKSMRIIEKVVTEKLNGNSDNNKLVLNKI